MLLLTLFASMPPAAFAFNPQVIGVTPLRATTTGLNGSGASVAQVEGGDGGATNWQVRPSFVGQPTSRFTYFSELGTSSAFPNSVGAESIHADYVASEFYGLSTGVATNVAHVDNYKADYFYDSIVAQSSPPRINARIVNQSFIFGAVPVSEQQQIDSHYDDYAARYNVLFVDGAGNGDPPQVTPPATAYNSIAVGAFYNGINYSSVGPTPDNGRSKPDITVAPHTATSFTAPQVSGAAALLLQAGLRGDGGAATNQASDSRTLKALLLNGAVKPASWTNGPASPLDARFGAGVLNVFNSYRQLHAGKQSNYTRTAVSTGSPHPPLPISTPISTRSGWDFATNTSSVSQDSIHHYGLRLEQEPSQGGYTVTVTLVWNRQEDKSGINDLNLYLYDISSGQLVACSTSLVDNVEHLYVSQLSPGDYDLQVFKSGGGAARRVTNSEAYALAFEAFSVSLSIADRGSAVLASWPVYPDGFVLETATHLTTASWTTNLPPPGITNGQNQLMMNSEQGNRFFRLKRPRF